jgi:hypothetical protein
VRCGTKRATILQANAARQVAKGPKHRGIPRWSQRPQQLVVVGCTLLRADAEPSPASNVQVTASPATGRSRRSLGTGPSPPFLPLAQRLHMHRLSPHWARGKGVRARPAPAQHTTSSPNMRAPAVLLCRECRQYIDPRRISEGGKCSPAACMATRSRALMPPPSKAVNPHDRSLGSALHTTLCCARITRVVSCCAFEPHKPTGLIHRARPAL